MSNIVEANRLVVGMCYSTLDGEYLGEFYSTRKGPGGQEYTFEAKNLSGNGLKFRKTKCAENTNSGGGSRKRKTRRNRKTRRSRKTRRNLP
jgi:hypothetical protein